METRGSKQEKTKAMGPLEVLHHYVYSVTSATFYWQSNLQCQPRFQGWENQTPPLDGGSGRQSHIAKGMQEGRDGCGHL